jgi:hypothetical protein
MPLPAGTKLGTYEVLTMIGAIGFGKLISATAQNSRFGADL